MHFFYIYYPFLLNMLRIDKEFEGISLTFLLNGDLFSGENKTAGDNSIIKLRLTFCRNSFSSVTCKNVERLSP
jgi:hypothetical protein